MADFVKLNPGFSRRIRTTFRFPDYSCEELAQMFLNMTLERGFTTEVSLEEIKDLIEKSTNEEFRKQWNAGVSEKIFTLAKEHLDERLISDSLSLVAENPYMIVITATYVHTYVCWTNPVHSKWTMLILQVPMVSILSPLTHT